MTKRGGRIRKVLKYVAGALVLLVAGFYAYVQATYQRDFGRTPMLAVVASKDADVIARGEYVTHAIAHCSACHGPAEYAGKRELAPDLANMSGGNVMRAGPLGVFYPANITPDADTGIAKTSDAELARVIRHGVSPAGTLDPFMTFAVGPMAEEDILAIISYLRSIKPVKNAVPKDEWGFLAKAIAGKFEPKKLVAPSFVKETPGAPSAERGAYIAGGPGMCNGCHSPFDLMQGMKMIDAPFSGGRRPDSDPTEEGWEIAAPNITTGGVLANFDEQQFVDRFKKVGRAVKGSKMPWESFARMTEDDLRSIHRYLSTKVQPSSRNVGPTRRKKGSFKSPE